jgi:hypothetical protein
LEQQQQQQQIKQQVAVVVDQKQILGDLQIKVNLTQEQMRILQISLHQLDPNISKDKNNHFFINIIQYGIIIYD